MQTAKSAKLIDSVSVIESTGLIVGRVIHTQSLIDTVSVIESTGLCWLSCTHPVSGLAGERKHGDRIASGS